VLGARLLPLLAERDTLPVLAFVFAEVENLEGHAVLEVQQSLSNRVHGETPDIACDPTAPQFLGYSGRRSGSPKEIGDE
jgi:hypothetical protein